MKKVCIDARMLGAGGIGTYLYNVLCRLKQQLFEVVLLTLPGSDKKWPFLQRFPSILCDAPIYSIKEQKILPKIIPACDLFWSPHYNVPLRRIRAKRRIVTIHDIFHLAFFSELSWKEKLYVKIVLSQAIRRSSAVITVSQFSCLEIKRFFSEAKEKIRVIPLGVNQKFFSPSSDKIKMEKIRKKFSLPEKYILFVGNVKPHKNIKGLLKAYTSLFYHKKAVDYPLIIVGEHQQLRTKEDIASFLDFFPFLKKNVRLLGVVPDEELPFLYQFASCLVFPSFYEGFGLPPLEAMSVGCPVIASKIPSLEEACGDAVYWIDPSNPISIAKGIEEVVSNKMIWMNLHKKGKERMQMFQWDDTALQHEQLILEILK